VLISAYACESGRGSEPGIGWSIAREAARHHDVWVITRSNNRARIDAELAREAVPSLHVVYYDLPAWARWWKRGARGTQLYYHLWQLRVGALARRLHRAHRFDVAQHATFGRYWMPSLLCRLPIPFVWGPVGGGEHAPTTLWGDGGARGRVEELARAAARWLGEHDPLVRDTARRAAVGLAVTVETAARLRGLGTREVMLYSAMGLRREDMAELLALPEPADAPVRFVSIGRMLAWKGFQTGLRAFAAADIPGAEYWLVGDGPALPRLRRLADTLGVRDRVRFCGAVPRAEALAILASSHALVHPSLHDSGGWVCLEAMSAGRPVICLALGGPAEMVTSETGILVPAVDAAQVHRDLTQALTRAAEDAALRRRLGAAARRRAVERYVWQTKGAQLADLYTRLVQAE
jgi:glycosyltransferase involved in cell wall biosynthesis